MWRASSPRSPSLSGAGEGFPGLQVGPVSVSAGCDPTYSIAYWWPVLGHEQRSAIWKQIWPVFRVSVAQQVAIHTLNFKQGDISLGGGDPRSSARWMYYVDQLEAQHMSQTQPGETPMTLVIPGSESVGGSETQDEASPELCA